MATSLILSVILKNLVCEVQLLTSRDFTSKAMSLATTYTFHAQETSLATLSQHWQHQEAHVKTAGGWANSSPHAQLIT